MIQPLGGNSRVYRIFKDPVMVMLCAAILILSMFIVTDHLTNWKTITFINGQNFSVIRTKADNVSLFLKEQNITMKKLDYITPAAHTVIVDNMKINLFRMEENIIGISEKIEIPEKNIKIGILKKGKSKLIFAGRNGILKKVYKILKKNGVECQRELIYRKIVSPSISKLTFIGTGKYKKIRYKNNCFTIKTKFLQNESSIPTIHLPKDFLPENLIVENDLIGKLIIKNDSKNGDFLVSGINFNKIPELAENKTLQFRIIK